MKKLITLAVVCVGALTLLSGCLKDEEKSKKVKKEQTHHSYKSKEIIDHDLV